MPRRRVRTPVEQLQPFERGHIVDLREAGFLHMLGTMYRWCVAAFTNGLCNIPTFVDRVLDSRVVQTHVKIEALCEQRWPPEQHPGKKSGHILHLLCHQAPLGTICLQQDSDHVCLSPGYHLHQQTRLLWRRERVDRRVE